MPMTWVEAARMKTSLGRPSFLPSLTLLSFGESLAFSDCSAGFQSMLAHNGIPRYRIGRCGST